MQDDAKEQSAQTCMHLNTSLQTSFVAFLDDPVTADVILKAGKTKLHAHRIVLAAQSPLFKAMFQVKCSMLGLHSSSDACKEACHSLRC